MSSHDLNPAAAASLADVPAPVIRPEHVESEFVRLLEQQTAKISSHWFLLSALGSMGLSLVLELRGHHRPSQFVGMWPAPLLALGIYNKIVKTLGTR
jgi:hypothetical protein